MRQGIFSRGKRGAGMSDVLRTVTFGVIAYNEHRYLPDLLDDLLKQTYSKRRIDVILVDGNSSDGTWEIMQSFQRTYSAEYRDIKVLKNDRRIQPSGWNVVIKNTKTDVLLRIDAHARLPEDFIEVSMDCIASGEFVCGGSRENIIDEDTPWKRMLLNAEKSVFGSGMASYRQDTKERKYVKSLFHGAYRREVLETVGLFNEELIRTEDNEYHFRIRKLGYHICYDPQIHSYYQTRSSLKGMIEQKYLNGCWIGRTLFVCPGCISMFHIVPLAFVFGILLTTLIGICGIPWPAKILWIMYGSANLLMTVTAIIGNREKSPHSFALPMVFLLLHVSYGVGTMQGIADIAVKKILGGGVWPGSKRLL